MLGVCMMVLTSWLSIVRSKGNHYHMLCAPSLRRLPLGKKIFLDILARISGIQKAWERFGRVYLNCLKCTLRNELDAVLGQ